jgi:hypothetical protein
MELVQNQNTEFKGEIMLPRLWADIVQELLKEEEAEQMEEDGKEEVAT